MNITYFLPHLTQSSGMERVLCIKANYLADVLGYNITIITYRQNGASIFFSFSPKIKMVHLDIPDPTFSLSQYGFFEKRKIYKNFIKTYEKKVEQFLLNNPQDICISLFLGAEYKFLHKIKDKSKKILEFHFNFNVGPLRILESKWNIKNLKLKYERTLLKKKLNLYDKFITLTEEDEQIWKKYLNNTHTIHNPITITPIEKPLLKNKQVLAVGRLTPQKGFDYLINAWKIVNRKHPDWHLNIYGEGELKDSLTNQIQNLSLNNHITLHPVTKNIEKIYNDNSIFVLSSRHEGFVLVLIEAMASGLPCVAFDCDGPKQMIDNGKNGFLTNVGNIEQMAEYIIQLIEDENLRHLFSKEAVKTAQKYNLDNIMKQWENLFISLKNKI